jgi:hypothetical protein
MAMMRKDMMARMAAEDARLKALVADMNMFTGEMKVDAMARIVTLLVERQTMMRRHMMETDMMEMHRRMMMPPIWRAIPGEPAGGPPSAGGTADGEPDEMCLPPTN